MSTKIIAADTLAGAIIDPSVGDGALVIQTGLAGAKVNAISIAADGRPTLLKTPIVTNPNTVSMVRLNTANGYGSTNTAIRRFTNTVTSQGTDITYADSAANGASFTINTAGVYAISYDDNFNGSGWLGLSLNSNQLTTAVNSITPANLLVQGLTPGANTSGLASVTVYLAVSDVIRAHAQVGAPSGTGSVAHFTITRVA